MRERRLITLSLLAFQGHKDQLEDHIRGALLSPEGGLSESELYEMMIHVAHYGGWAAGTSGQGVVKKVLRNIKPCIERPHSKKRIVFCDFDRTITREESFVGMLHCFTPKTAGDVLPKIHSDERSIRNGVCELLKSIPKKEIPKIESYACECEIRKGVKTFLRFLAEKDVPFIIISGGLQIMVEAVLKKEEIFHLVKSIYAVKINDDPENDYLEPEPDKLKIRLGCNCDDQEEEEMISKLRAMEAENYGEFDEVIFIGDGKTDVKAANSLIMDPKCVKSPQKDNNFAKTIIFARDDLADKLLDGHCIQWDDFYDIFGFLNQRWR